VKLNPSPIPATYTLMGKDKLINKMIQEILRK
jgi:hypothetical protein